MLVVVFVFVIFVFVGYCCSIVVVIIIVIIVVAAVVIFAVVVAAAAVFVSSYYNLILTSHGSTSVESQLPVRFVLVCFLSFFLSLLDFDPLYHLT